MFLQRLREYADGRMELPPVLYSETPIRYVIDLDLDGTPRTGIPTDTADPSSPRGKRGVRRLAPQVARSVGIKPLLLADNGEYTLGLAREESKAERVAACHDAYRELVRRCAEATAAPEVVAVQRFLDGEPAARLKLPDDFDRGATITFRVHQGMDAVFPIDQPRVQSFWAADNDPGSKGARVLQCLVCGQERPVLERLQGKIKGIPGGQTSGTSIISANAEAFESYGLEASLIAPTCGDCAERFTKALNKLIDAEDSHIRLAGSVFVFWAREPVIFNFRASLTEPDPQQVEGLLSSLRSGKWGDNDTLDPTPFYAASLSASGGRAVVRDWIDTTVGEAQRRLARWFRLQQLVDGRGGPGRFLGIAALAGATVRELKDLSPTTQRVLMRSALTGEPLPWGLLAQAVRRGHAEQGMTRPRAALIKLVLLSQMGNDDKEESLVSLDTTHMEPGYHCGRLLAVLEQVQRAALGDINATIVDRFYGTASSAPQSVFSRLLRGAQPHMAKLRRDRPGAWRALDARLGEVLTHLDKFPSTLDLQQQGLFALGYYHQRAHDRAQAHEAAERRRQGRASEEDAAHLEAMTSGSSDDD